MHFTQQKIVYLPKIVVKTHLCRIMHEAKRKNGLFCPGTKSKKFANTCTHMVRAIQQQLDIVMGNTKAWPLYLCYMKMYVHVRLRAVLCCTNPSFALFSQHPHVFLPISLSICLVSPPLSFPSFIYISYSGISSLALL